ncbi:hypothetical protein [Photobacterium kishitanii]|uniref:hypothetical protein n=1 Tax=Photobacterium kishitanii TaxID=318456 RepID=UPI000435F2E6|nr:hypothetical protein [Photobacterium kishitanii]CEO39148.1 hypothetical protein PPBDW_I21164 [Photobacterium kishitanii]
MTWNVLNIDYINTPSEALNTEIQISTAVVNYFNSLPLGAFFKCPISVMHKDSLQIQVFFPPELVAIALLLGATPAQKPDFYALNRMTDIHISPIGLDTESSYFQSIFVNSNYS